MWMQSLWKMFTYQLLLIRVKMFQTELDMVLLTILWKSELASDSSLVNIKISMLPLNKNSSNTQYYIASICSFIIKSTVFSYSSP